MSRSLEEELRNETLKWLQKIEKEIERIKVNKEINENKKEEEEFLENIKAYISDSHYFLKEKDLIRAFECVVWAWAWLEIGIKIGLLKVEV